MQPNCRELVQDLNELQRAKREFDAALKKVEVSKQFAEVDGLQAEIIQRANSLRERLMDPETREQLANWSKIYWELFKIPINESQIRIPRRTPEQKEEFTFLIVVAESMTPQRVFEKCVELFSTTKWTEDSLNNITQSDRSATSGSYAIWVSEKIETTDGGLDGGRSSSEDKTHGITLEERMLLGIFYFANTGEYLDARSLTLCYGSRYSDGRIPMVGQEDGMFRIGRHNAIKRGARHHPNIRWVVA
ncbi:hypothetical protein EPO05_03055 [Patescibacteria group bacterium]|nr:MAG: hypothetical protein EPO05_03055 [Patescibacteria group bacterium]